MWLFESSIAKLGCEDAKYLWEPDLNKMSEELKAFVNKDTVMVHDGEKHKTHSSQRDCGALCDKTVKIGVWWFRW